MSRVRVPDGVPNGPLVKWPKTPASHAGNSGSNPLRVTKGINNARTTRYILVGVDDVEGPPVPIPNTVVKLNSAENTWLEAAREDRSTPTLFLIALIAQSVEHAAVNRGVTGSSPVWGAKGKHSLLRVLSFCFSIVLQLVSLCFGRCVAAVNWLTDLRSQCEMKQVR